MVGMKYFLVLISFLSLTSSKAFALIDYSESVPVSSETKTANNSYKKMPEASTKSAGSSRGLAWKSDLSLTTHYESLEISGQKYGALKFDTHIQTPANVFFNASYWHAQSGKENSSGNPKLVVGFNWLKLGSASDEAKFDIFGGLKLSAKSQLGSSRTDKIVGVETTKRFGTFGLGIGYDLTMTGEASSPSEYGIGNINHIAISGGWMVSPDIQFELELDNFTIGKSKDPNRLNGLIGQANFSTFSPKINLGLAPAVNLEMGARFRIKKAQESANLFGAKVFDLNGANANSLFAGLNLTI